MNQPIRYPAIDTLRGMAIVAMIAYHFGFDLNMQGYILQDLNHSTPWQIARNLILSTFLFVSGFSLALAQHHTIKQRFTRLARIAGCALLVSVGSYFMFPDSWIYFGVLHFVVLGTLCCWVFARHEKWLLPLGLAAIGVGFFYKSPTFDQSMLQWLGMMTYKPITEDYVPLLPWLGVMFIGLYVGQWSLKSQTVPLLAITPPVTLKPLAWLGRRSLAVYMLHQPILLGILWIYGATIR